MSNEVVVTARSVSEALIPGISAIDIRKLTSALPGDHDSLGPSRGTRRIEKVGEMLRLAAHREVRRREFEERFGLPVE